MTEQQLACQRAYRAKNRTHVREVQRKWNAANRERVYAKKKAWLERNPEMAKTMIRRAALRRYGLSPEQYDEIYDSQRGICPICYGRFPRRGRNGLVVDHNHKSGKVRGLLCSDCNKALGLLKESLVALLAMQDYIASRAG